MDISRVSHYSGVLLIALICSCLVAGPALAAAVQATPTKTTTGNAVFVTTPSKATVFIDGNLSGTTKLTVKGLSTGKHTYLLHKMGYKNMTGVFVISAGKTTTVTKTLQENKIPIENPVMCNQPYALCDTSACTPLPNDPSKVNCTCSIENGVSSGLGSCKDRKTVNLYNSSSTGLMIRGGAMFGQITSTYSFLHALPLPENKIPNRKIDPNYTGNIILKYCKAPQWADCLDMKCIVPAADPKADVKQNRKAADYAICECTTVNDDPEFYIASAEGADICSDPDICTKYIWSAGDKDLMKAGIKALKAYLAAHPKEDPAQQYAMAICETDS